MRVRGARPQQGKDGGCCACLRGRALMYMHAQYSCVCKIGQEKDRTWAHMEWAAPSLGVIISRFPPKPFFHLKRLVAADWALAGRERKAWIISAYNSPQNYCRTKERRERREGRGGSRRNFLLFFCPFSPSIASPCSTQGTWTRGPRVLHCGC